MILNLIYNDWMKLRNIINKSYENDLEKKRPRGIAIWYPVGDSCMSTYLLLPAQSLG